MTTHPYHQLIGFFGVEPLSKTSPHTFPSMCAEFLAGEKTHVIFTPNPEILLLARENQMFTQVLNSADLLVPDGFGLSLLSFIKYRRWLRRLPGIDVAELLLEHAAHEHIPVVLLGGKKGATSHAVRRLQKRFIGLRITATGEDVCFNKAGLACSQESENRIRDIILTYEPKIILVGLGAPRQENWIASHKNDFPSVRIMMAVGGAFDIWSGRLRRAPKILRVVGFEWLWRLIQEPKRFSRILRATTIFPWHALNEKSRH